MGELILGAAWTCLIFYFGMRIGRWRVAKDQRTVKVDKSKVDS